MANLFTKHPNSVSETYFQHFGFAFKTGVYLICLGLAAIVHSIFPFWFEKMASNGITKLASELAKRTKKSEQ